MVSRILSLLVLVSLVGGVLAMPVQTAAQSLTPAQQSVPASGDCRFGGTFSDWSSNTVIDNFDFASVGMGYYLDWSPNKNLSVPGYIRFMPVLLASDENYPKQMVRLPALVAANPGAIWIIGNEPEDRGMDHITPEAYAEHFYEYAKIIRSADPTAKLAFGTIVMPTVLRLMYLDFAWARLIELAGSQQAASALVDIWSPHGFVLNEQGDENGETFWGSGIPEGFYERVPNWRDLQEVIGLYDVYNFDIFKTRMIRFRQWMKDHGEQNKPLWLTEYGQLFPPYPKPEKPFVSLPEEVTAEYMVKTFDWMLTTADPDLGMPSDGNRLVQKWFWYSINGGMDLQGGTLVDPETLKSTIVGDVYLNYVPPAGSTPIRNPDIYPAQLTATYIQSPTSLWTGHYTLHLRVRNAVLADHYAEVRLMVTSGEELLATRTGKTARCGGDIVWDIDLNDLPLSAGGRVCANLQPTTLTDINPANNTACVDIPAKKNIFVPTIKR